MNGYLLSLATSIAIFAILSVSLSLLIGHLGIFSMAHAALFGVGAFAYAFLSVDQGWSSWPAAAAAVVITALAGAVMAVPSLRVSGDYFIVASFALQVVASSIFGNWTAVTGGTSGIPGIMRPSIGSLNLFGNGAFFGYALIAALVVTGLAFWLVRSPYGRMLHVIRDDEVVAATMGKPVGRTKALVTVLAAAFAGLGGVIYGQYMMYVSPDSFDVSTSVSIITMVVVGGMTSVWGSVLGAGIIVAIPQLLQQVNLSDSVAGPVEQMLFGAVLVVIMFTRPQGLLADRTRRSSRANPPAPQPPADTPKERITHAS